MFENIMKIFRRSNKKEGKASNNSKDAAKERLHLVLMQDRANVSADFLELMKQEIIDVIKKYIDVDESAIDVRLTNKDNGDGTNGAPALYANIPIINIKNEARKTETKVEIKTETKIETKKDNQTNDFNEEKEQEKNKEKNNLDNTNQEMIEDNKKEEKKDSNKEKNEENNEEKETKLEKEDNSKEEVKSEN